MVGLVAALALGGGLAVVRGAQLGAHKSAFHLEKARVERGDVIGKVTATGTLSALVTVQVGSQVSGRISELAADFGSRVEKGEIIARLDARLFAAEVQQQRASRDAARGQLAAARAKRTEADIELRRAEELDGKKLIAQAELDSKTAAAAAAHAAVQAAEGNLEQARASYNQAKVNLGYTTIASPIGGVVISRNVDVGQTVAASLQAPTLYTIAEDLGKMQVHTNVSEADVGKLATGLPATFVVDAYPDDRFQGVIRQIRDAPQSLQNVVTYDAVIDVDNPDHKLRPGMTANVTFVYAERKGVLRIPSAALRFRPPPELLAEATGAPSGAATGHGKKKKEKEKEKAAAGTTAATATAPAPTDGRARSVWVLRGDRPVEVKIGIGIADGSQVEITSGELHEHDVLVTDAVSKAERAENGSKKSKGILF
jgi:HlyD family secretion protein